MSESRNIPLPIQREVRKKCGFGCVVCGMPIYEYHHIDEWSEVRRHDAENIVLLCGTHHSAATKRLLTKGQILLKKETPYNLSEGGKSSEMPFFFNGDSCSVVIGTGIFRAKFRDEISYLNAITVDGIPLVGFILQDSHLLLNINLFDKYNNPLLRIINNRIEFSSDPWDIQFIGKKLSIRDKPRNFIIEITFNPPNEIIIERGNFYCNGIKIEVDNNETKIFNSKNQLWTLGYIVSDGALNGIMIGERSKAPGSGLLDLPLIERF